MNKKLENILNTIDEMPYSHCDINLLKTHNKALRLILEKRDKLFLGVNNWTPDITEKDDLDLLKVLTGE